MLLRYRGLAREALKRLIGWLTARSLTAPSTTNKLVTQAECTSAPSNADGDKLVNQADCTTAATVANPVLSVGGLTARSVSAPGVVAGTRLLTEADRPYVTADRHDYAFAFAKVAAPAWGSQTDGTFRTSLHRSALPATITDGLCRVKIYTVDAQQIGLRLVTSGGLVLATGAETGANSGVRVLVLTVDPAAFTWSGWTDVYLEYQTLSGAGVGAIQMPNRVLHVR